MIVASNLFKTISRNTLAEKGCPLKGDFEDAVKGDCGITTSKILKDIKPIELPKDMVIDE